MPDTNDPNSGDSTKGREKVLRAEGYSTEKGDSAAETERASLRHDGPDEEMAEVGILVSGSDILTSRVFSQDVAENPATLPSMDFTESVQAMQGDESVASSDPEAAFEELVKQMSMVDLLEDGDNKDKVMAPKPPPVVVEPVGPSCYPVVESPSKIRPTIDAKSLPIPEGVDPDNFNRDERRIYSDFEKECRGLQNFFQRKASKLLAETEESYLSLGNKNVKRLEIINPSYDLISKDYKPMVGIVGNTYRIVIDVSLFSPENIAVHVVSDMINVYAREKFEGSEGYRSMEFHEVYKIPSEHVAKSEFKAHMLNPLKLLCICAPIKTVSNKQMETTSKAGMQENP